MIKVLESSARLSSAKEKALNLLLLQKGGSFKGMALFRISWAARDNFGLRKKHVCGKTDPIDWECSCPTEKRDAAVPLCFHPIQASYHLLIWSPPSLELAHFENALGEDTSKGTYNCILHFVDPKTNVPFDPTTSIIENIIPALSIMTESMRAALAGCDAIVRRERQARINREFERRKQQEAAYDSKADAILRDNTPAFGGKPHTGAGPKHRQSADLVLTDLKL